MLALPRGCEAGFGRCQSRKPLSPLPGCSPTPYDYPTPESSSRSSATDDFCYVFVVELERGPIGLGMGLIDGVVSSQLVSLTLLEWDTWDVVYTPRKASKEADGFPRELGCFSWGQGGREGSIRGPLLPGCCAMHAKSTAVLQLERANRLGSLVERK